MLVNSAASFAKEKLKAFDAGHDWSHTERVLVNARKIHKLENQGDPEIIELACILHDIADTKFHKGSEEDGGNMAFDFLVEKGLPIDKAEHVRKIINSMSFKKRMVAKDINSIEYQIVQDADRLDAIGAIGIARAFNYGGYKNREIYNPDIPVRSYASFEEYKKSDAPTINHFYEKLFLIKDLMNTNAGKAMAQERHDYMHEFVRRFKEEWGE